MRKSKKGTFANQGSRVVVTMPDNLRNAHGEMGPICEKCAGFGFTYNLDGEKLECKICHETGISVNLADLQKQVIELTRLVKMLYTELKSKGLTNIE